MPETKTQNIIFTMMMSFAMVAAMCLFNMIIETHGISWTSLKEVGLSLSYLWPAALILELVIVAKPTKMMTEFLEEHEIGHFIGLICIALVNAGFMCPMMSAIQCSLHNGISSLPILLPALVLVNFPIALLWQLLIAGPSVRFMFKRIFRRGK